MYILYIIVLKIKLITNLHALSVAIHVPPNTVASDGNTFVCEINKAYKYAGVVRTLVMFTWPSLAARIRGVKCCPGAVASCPNAFAFAPLRSNIAAIVTLSGKKNPIQPSRLPEQRQLRTINSRAPNINADNRCIIV